jgi:hypothetical protein
MLLFSWFLLCGLLIIVFGEGFTVVAQNAGETHGGQRGGAQKLTRPVARLSRL